MCGLDRCQHVSLCVNHMCHCVSLHVSLCQVLWCVCPPTPRRDPNGTSRAGSPGGPGTTKVSPPSLCLPPSPARTLHSSGSFPPPPSTPPPPQGLCATLGSASLQNPQPGACPQSASSLCCRLLPCFGLPPLSVVSLLALHPVIHNHQPSSSSTL